MSRGDHPLGPYSSAVDEAGGVDRAINSALAQYYPYGIAKVVSVSGGLATVEYRNGTGVAPWVIPYGVTVNAGNTPQVGDIVIVSTTPYGTIIIGRQSV